MKDNLTAQRVSKTGYDLIRDPLLNKGTGFSAEERQALHLSGLLPAFVNTIEQQAERSFGAIASAHTPLEKYVQCAALQDRNEQLYYKVLIDNIEELMPIVYTPTVGLATQNFSQVFQRGRGLWITPDMRGEIAHVLECAVADRNIRLLVATDSESILGIGDQGAGGMAISVGKLSLYVAGAGIHPSATLPICLDVGTNNQDLLDDELYLGWRQTRLAGTEYDEFIDEFVAAVKTCFPDALLQWEDFRKDNALTLLNRHRSNMLSFNDDIQGTGAVALAAILSGLRITGQPLADQRIVIFGAGAAGLGIANQIKSALRQLSLSDADIMTRVAVLDSRGLLVLDSERRDAYKADLSWSPEIAAHFNLDEPNRRDLASVVHRFKPSVIIGSSGQSGAFDREIVSATCEAHERPIILPFSNPTDRSEATPADVIEWSGGKALVATGSPFEPVDYGDRTIEIGQGNNVFVFPGLGLGALAARCTIVSDNMISAAADALAQAVTDEELSRGLLFPAIVRLREVSRLVAIAVARQASQDGHANRDLEAAIERIDNDAWTPSYVPYVYTTDQAD